jgi:drug/metabolite transporter superfamily protein YnfA
MNRALARLLHLYLLPLRARHGHIWVIVMCGGWILWVIGLLASSVQLVAVGWALVAPGLLWIVLLFAFWMPVIVIHRRRQRRTDCDSSYGDPV